MSAIDFEQTKNSEDIWRQKSDSGSKSDMEGSKDSSDEEKAAPFVRKKRIQLLPDSDSDSETLQNVRPKTPEQNITDGTDETDTNIFKKLSQKSSKTSDSSSSDDEGNKNRDKQNISDDSDDNSPKILKKISQKSSEPSESSSCNEETNKSKDKENITDNSDDNNDTNIFKKVSQKSSMSSSSSGSDETRKKKEPSRIKSKRNKLMQKFKGLVKSRVRDTQEENSNDSGTKKSSNENSESSENEEDSIERIKQKIKDRTNHLKSTIYDPDTSDEESTPNDKETKKSQKPRKTTKLTSPKPARMSAKQAMENMKKIKSESNRMLREKEVSLPYHRPKALSLKDIMSRRRPAVSADGKALSIKMNEEQLKQYALALEQRQKEVIELCKSDTEEEGEEEEQDNVNTETTEETETKNDTFYDSILDSTKNDEIEAHDDKNENSEVILNENETINETHDKENNDDSEVPVPHEKESLDASEEVNKVEDKTPNETVTEESNVNCKDESKRVVSEDIFKNTDILEENAEKSLTEDKSIEKKDASAEMSLVYNSADDTADGETEINKEAQDSTNEKCEENNAPGTEESQLISLHYEDTEKMDSERFDQNTEKESNGIENMEVDEDNDRDEFSDNEEINMEDIDKLIENAEILSQTAMGDVNSPMLIKDPNPMKMKPKLMGAPGMVIDLDGTDPCQPKKLTGVELLKERFTFFAKLRTPEEREREKEKRVKPGAQHLKLKQELEEQIAEQRSIEWAKRLEEEKQQQKEIDAIRGEDSDNDLDAIEAKLEEKEILEKSSSSEEEEEEEEEDDVEIKDKPRKSNPMIADEAEESDCDEGNDGNAETLEQNDEDVIDDADGDVEDNDEIADGEEDSESEESSEEEIEESKLKKGRILKAFEDSDDETPETKEPETISVKSQNNDDEIHLAQRQKSYSEDLFTSQESATLCTDKVVTEPLNNSEERDLGTQTFSILNSATSFKCPVTDNLDAIDNLPNLVEGNINTDSQVPDTQKSQEIGEDLLALCTGKFYDNQFVSQLEENPTSQNKIPLDDDEFDSDKDSQENIPLDANSKNYNSEILNDAKCNEITVEKDQSKKVENDMHNTPNDETNRLKNSDIESNTVIKDKEVDIEKQTQENTILKSILDELDEPEPQKVNNFFTDNSDKKDASISNTQLKKKFVIDSDEEGDSETKVKTKKLKKRKLEQRALQISDDEDEEENDLAEELEEDDLSEPEEEGERLVEYDSEENEVVIQPKKPKRLGEFFEQEAELTSEDEWMGSGDEDERGLDRLEREAGDDDTFNQRTLQAELGQIHMREVLDQDKREVRLIQELLFEDGDLGDGHRQRKFRWKNADAVEGETPLDLLESQEEEFGGESEEQWRKQRHEREMFLRQLKEKDQEELENTQVVFSRTSIIKASLSKSSTNVTIDVAGEAEVAPKKTKDIPSPKKPFTLYQHNYHNSLLTRGRGALARLAALASPLAEDDDDAPKVSLAPSSKRNFVFAAITPDEKQPKVTKRKAEVNVGTPRLLKKMKSEEQTNRSKSLLDLI